MYSYPYLKDTNFLYNFDKSRNKEQFLKIIILDWKNEYPVKEITGSVIDGNISLDGASAMRRTANISLLLDEYDYKIEDVKNLISINKKVQIMIGFTNNTDKYTNYPILWFPQGIYLIVSVAISKNVEGIKASLTLHDKMALLNGECGGIIPAATVFNEIQNEDSYGNITTTYPTVVQIIQELVNHFGNEQLGKIIIKDLQPIIKQVLKWNGEPNNPLLIYKNDNETKVSTLYYEIYKSIFMNLFPNKDFNTICGSTKQITNLQELISNLEQFNSIVKNNSEIIEEEIQSLEKTKAALEQRKFSLASEIKTQIQSMYNDLNFIYKKTQESLQEVTENNKISLNPFLSASFKEKDESTYIYYKSNYMFNNIFNYKLKQPAIFDVKNLSQLYQLTSDTLQKMQALQKAIQPSSLKDEISNNIDKNSINYYLFYLLFNLNIDMKEADSFFTKDNYQNGQFKLIEDENNVIQYLLEFPKKTIFLYTYDYTKKRNNRVKITNLYLKIYYSKKSFTIKTNNKNLEKDIKIEYSSYSNKYFGGYKNNYVYQNLINLGFKPIEDWNVFQNILIIRKYLKESEIFTRYLSPCLDSLLVELLSTLYCMNGEYFQHQSESPTNSAFSFSVEITKMISDFLSFLQRTLEQLQNLVSTKNNMLTSANMIKESLLNFSLLKDTALKNGSNKTVSANIKNKNSFNSFIDSQMNKLEELINIAPFQKKNTQKQIQLYRQAAKDFFTLLKQKINKMKENIRDLNFSSQHQHILVQNFPKVKDNLTKLEQPLVSCFEPVLDFLKNSINKTFLIFNNNSYEDTTLEKETHKTIFMSLDKINTSLSNIKKYKIDFVNKSLINLQKWLNENTFNENNFNLPTILNSFTALPKLSSINEIIVDKNQPNFKFQSSLLSNQTKNIQKLYSNKQLLNKIIQELPNYIEVNINDNTKESLEQQINKYIKKLKEIIKNQDELIKSKVNTYNNNNNYKDFFNQIKKIQIFQTGEDVGYTLTDFIYPGSLTASAGETITSVLDKIKNTLGNYEYFYDINGNFIFQQVRNYLNKSYSTYLLQENSSPNYNYNNTNGKYIYNFNDGEIIQSYSNSINYQDIKNDFVVWGEKKSADGKKYPIRYHLAIDTKPAVFHWYYIPIEKKIIQDYLSVSDFPIQGEKGIFYYALKENEFYEWVSAGDDKESSFFGYKKTNIKIQQCEKITDKPNQEYPSFLSNDYRTELYLNGVTNETFGLYSNDYYTELKNEWPKLFNFYQGAIYAFVKKNPDNIDYYLDLLSTSNLTSKFGVSLIGKRTKIITNNNINCIFEPVCPNYVFNISTKDINKMINKNQNKEDQEKEKKELTLKINKVNDYFEQWNTKNLLSQFSKKIDVSYDIYKNFANGGAARSAYEQIRSVLYQYLTYNEQVSLTTIPIYYLEPNNLIQINDEKSNISGNYLIKSISLPLNGSGTMSISCSKAIDKI